eukprot:Sdes_comp20924_c1_seq4m18342
MRIVCFMKVLSLSFSKTLLPIREFTHPEDPELDLQPQETFLGNVSDLAPCEGFPDLKEILLLMGGNSSDFDICLELFHQIERSEEKGMALNDIQQLIQPFTAPTHSFKLPVEDLVNALCNSNYIYRVGESCEVYVGKSHISKWCRPTLDVYVQDPDALPNDEEESLQTRQVAGHQLRKPWMDLTMKTNWTSLYGFLLKLLSIIEQYPGCRKNFAFDKVPILCTHDLNDLLKALIYNQDVVAKKLVASKECSLFSSYQPILINVSASGIFS